MNRLLLVDNDSDTLIELRALCDALSYDVSTVHCTALKTCSYNDYDLIVLSGGYWYDDELKHLETYAQELELIRTTSAPVLGICLGMQLMHVAFSGNVPLLDEPQSGTKKISINTEGQTKLGLPGSLQVHKNHTRGVVTASEYFDVLGFSPGHLEIMQHKTRSLLGVQFHPEIGPLEENKKLLQSLIHGISPQQ